MKPDHPWRKVWNDQQRLDDAKKLGARRAMRKYSKEHYDEYDKVRSREYRRQQSNIPLELPLMKPWDHVKGRV